MNAFVPIKDESKELNVKHRGQMAEADAPRRILFATAIFAKVLICAFQFLFMQKLGQTFIQCYVAFTTKAKVQLVESRGT